MVKFVVKKMVYKYIMFVNSLETRKKDNIVSFKWGH